MAGERFITVWRKADDPFEWDFYISATTIEAESVFRNVTAQGHATVTTYPLGEKIEALSAPREEWTP